MRLIDADELIKDIMSYKTMPEIRKAICEVIDNAPTVPLPDFKEGYKQAIIDGKTNFSRPKGEWIRRHGKSYKLITDEGTLIGEFTKCPKCLYDEARGSNFCPNCGADMRKGGAECD